MADKKGYDKLKKMYPGTDVDYALLQLKRRARSVKSTDAGRKRTQAWVNSKKKAEGK